MLRASNDCLCHVLVVQSDDPSAALLSLDDAGGALEAAVRHSLLLGAIEDDCDAVADLVLVHDASDVEATALLLRAAKDTAGSLTSSVTSAHDIHPSTVGRASGRPASHS